MPLFAQIALGVVVAGGIGFGVWNHQHRNEMSQLPTTMNDRSKADASAAIKLTTGNTNTDLDRDMVSIDSQLKLVNESSTDVDQSMNDKPVSE